MPRLLFYAPNVHTGGGLTLLRALMDAWPAEQDCTAFLDSRAKDVLLPPSGWRVIWCRRTLLGALQAELRAAILADQSTALFSFNSLLPVFSRSPKSIVYLHHAYFVGLGPKLRGRILVRVSLEKIIFTLIRRRVTEFWVQTPTIKRALVHYYRWRGDGPSISIVPFAGTVGEGLRADTPLGRYDFVYVSDGAPHKNHLGLLEAWKLLARDGLRPSLAVTLGPRDQALWNRMAEVVAQFDLEIVNLGEIPHDEVVRLYGRAGALVFPSTTETFGLPMIEAAKAGIPILAAETDFVRDACTPDQTFDPMSPVSIARAVKRQLRVPERPVELLSPKNVACRIADLVDDCSKGEINASASVRKVEPGPQVMVGKAPFFG